MRLALAAAIVFAFAASGLAEDSPGLARAKELVEAERGDPHREKMRIVWPETVEATPPEGAEVVIITGFTDIAMTRLVWREGKVEARRVYTVPVWHDDPDGEPFRAWTFDVSAEAFATAWSAARYILGAHDERVAPRPAVELGGGGANRGHHTGSSYRRLRLADKEEPLQAGDPHGPYWNGEAILNWDGVQNGSVFRAFASLVPERREALRESADLDSWTAFLTSEFRRAAKRLDPDYSGEDRLLLSVAVQIAGEIGDDATVAAMDAMEQALRMDQRCEWAAGVIGEIEVARTRIRLRLRWDAAHVRSLLNERRPQSARATAVELWIRRRYREREPVAYLAFLTEERSRGSEPRGDDVARTLDTIRSAGLGESADTLRPYLGAPDADTRVAAARAILTVVADDRQAAETIVSVLRDASVRPNLSRPSTRWPRIDALECAVDRHLIDAEGLRELLTQESSQCGWLVRALLDGLRRTPAPPTAEETLAAWRRVVDRDAESAIELAVEALLDLKDAASREKLAAALERLRSYSRGVYRRDVDSYSTLRKRFGAEMPEPPPPK